MQDRERCKQLIAAACGHDDATSHAIAQSLNDDEATVMTRTASNRRRTEAIVAAAIQRVSDGQAAIDFESAKVARQVVLDNARLTEENVALKAVASEPPTPAEAVVDVEDNETSSAVEVTEDDEIEGE